MARIEWALPHRIQTETLQDAQISLGKGVRFMAITDTQKTVIYWIALVSVSTILLFITHVLSK